LSANIGAWLENQCHDQFCHKIVFRVKSANFFRHLTSTHKLLTYEAIMLSKREAKGGYVEGTIHLSGVRSGDIDRLELDLVTSFFDSVMSAIFCELWAENVMIIF
jgi:hypothetical protein